MSCCGDHVIELFGLFSVFDQVSRGHRESLSAVIERHSLYDSVEPTPLTNTGDFNPALDVVEENCTRRIRRDRLSEVLLLRSTEKKAENERTLPSI